jgi:polyisoprenoid-binding protein YceI
MRAIVAEVDCGPFACYSICIKRTTVRIHHPEGTLHMTAISATTPIPANTTWTVDPVHSTVGFAVKHMVVSTFRGQFEDYSATLTANEDGTLTLQGRVAADSIAVKDENLATHLKAPDFFDTERHPYVTFDSTLVRADNGSLIVDGELTIKGNSRPIEARGVITEPHETFGGVAKVGLELEAVVDRTQYGLDWNAPLPKGGFALANEVKLTINLELAQPEA